MSEADNLGGGPGSSGMPVLDRQAGDALSGGEDLMRELERLRRQVQEMGSKQKVVVAWPKKKVRKFHGEQEVDGEYSIEDFVEEVKGLLRGEDDREERKQLVLSHVEGAAKREVRSCGKELSTAEAVLDALLSAFGDRRSIPALLADFTCLLYTSPSPRDLSTSRMPSSA